MEIILCDDQALVRGGIRRILEGESDIDVVGEAESATDALKLVSDVCFDVLLTEMRLPDGDGFQIARGLPEARPGCQYAVVFLTTMPTREEVFECLSSGARGILVKSDSPEEIIAGVRSVAAGHSTLSRPVHDLFLNQILHSSLYRPQRLPADLNGLTEREVEVLRFVAEGMNNREIAQILSVSETTVKSHVSRLLTKLALRDRGQAIVMAFKVGLIDPGGGARRTDTPARGMGVPAR